MRRLKLVAFIGVITVAIAGCASEETPPVATSPSVSPSTAVSPQPSPAATKPAPTQPLVAQKPSAPAVSGLIQPTNSQERARQVQTEIKNQSRDPFAGLQPNITVAPAASPQPVPPVAGLPKNQPGNQPAGGTPNRTSSQTGGRPSTPTRGTATAQGNKEGSTIQPKVAIASPSIPKGAGPLGFNIPPAVPRSQTAALPPKPSTETAKAVEVTGVVTIAGRTPQAIVVAPGDGTSRYVGVGQRISNGRVLVKRIEMRDGSEPIVILEENGVEVARAVGEKPPQASKPAG